jgi:hypothetical protein
LSGLTVTGKGQSYVDLAWNATTRASSYTVAYSTSSNGTYTTVLDTNGALSGSVTGLNASTTYYFKVTPINNYGSGTPQTVSATTDAPPPPADTTPPEIYITSRSGNNTMFVGWSASDNVGIANFKTYISGPNNTTLALKSTVSSATTSYTYTSDGTGSAFVDGATYKVRVYAYDAAGNNSYADDYITYVVPKPPSGVGTLVVGTVQKTAVNLSWSAATGADNGYRVEYRVVGSPSFTMFTSGLTNTYTTVTGLVADTNYEFKVYAQNAVGNGTPSTATQRTLSNRPNDFAWTTSTNYKTMVEWNNLKARINDFRTYKGLGQASFTSHTTLTAVTFNEIRNAINAMSPPTSPPNTVSTGQIVLGSYFNSLRDSLNSIQ